MSCQTDNSTNGKIRDVMLTVVYNNSLQLTLLIYYRIRKIVEVEFNIWSSTCQMRAVFKSLKISKIQIWKVCSLILNFK